jgi:hypothetical protein
LRRAAGLLAFSFVFACAARVDSGASEPTGSSLAASAEGAARALARYYQTENDGAADAYIERATARREPVARSEACRLPSGALSLRPTVLANPPLEPAAIEQRRALLADLGAYASALDALATDRAAVPAAALETLRGRTAELVRAANAHGSSGDLFIEDAATTLAGGVARLGNAHGTAATIRALESTGPTVGVLATVLAGDFTRQRKATIDATALAYGQWQARVRARPDAANGAKAADPPFCSEPAIFDGSDEREAGHAGAGVAGPASARGARLFRRMDAVRRVDLSPVLQAMTTFDAAELRSLREPGNAPAVADALAARERLSKELYEFTRVTAAAIAPAPAAASEVRRKFEGHMDSGSA